MLPQSRAIHLLPFFNVIVNATVIIVVNLPCVGFLTLHSTLHRSLRLSTPTQPYLTVD